MAASMEDSNDGRRPIPLNRHAASLVWCCRQRPVHSRSFRRLCKDIRPRRPWRRPTGDQDAQIWIKRHGHVLDVRLPSTPYRARENRWCTVRLVTDQRRHAARLLPRAVDVHHSGWWNNSWWLHTQVHRRHHTDEAHPQTSDQSHAISCEWSCLPSQPVSYMNINAVINPRQHWYWASYSV